MSQFPKDFKYGSRIPNKARDEMSRENFDRLVKDPYFCIMPWIHLHAFPDGRAYPCCLTNANNPVGNMNQQTMREIWNSDGMRELRLNMLEGRPSEACSRCYEQESHGFVSMRHSSSQNFGHNVALADTTNPDGSLDWFQLRYYDIRFSNLCNFRCRSCGGQFSSNWYDDEVRMYGELDRKKIMYAGRHEEDMWEQMQEHIPHLEQIYFAGGEPLIMEEHYRLLNELIKREMFHVRLLYNTNFSQLRYKKQDVLELWKQFDSVSIGASLDGMGPRGEYIRKGTIWADIERNRERMLEVCPGIDFYVSPTLSIMNAYHLPDFHRDWVGKGFLRPQDLNVNILQDPMHYRIDVLPLDRKMRVQERYLEHLEWLRPQDHLGRATSGYESAIKFMFENDNSHLIRQFFLYTDRLDIVRDEKFDDIFPELRGMRK